MARVIDAPVKWAPHVYASYTERVEGDPMPEPQRITCKCMLCGAEWRGDCSSGMVHTHIARFAMVHFHHDPLARR